MTPGTLIVGSVLAVIVGAIIWKMYKDRKNGKGGCGGNCGSCSGGCH